MSAKKNTLESQEFSENIIDTVREPLIILDQDLRVVTASRSFYEFFKVNPEETVGQLIYDLGNRQWDIPKLRELLETILPEKATFDNYEVEHDFATIGKRTMLLNARQIERVLGKEKIILLAIEDITKHKRLENILKESEELYKGVFNNASDGIVLLEKREGKIIHVNLSAENMLGYSTKECIGNKLQDIGFMSGVDDFQTIMQKLNENGITNYIDVSLATKSGQHINTDIYITDKTKVVQCNIRDVTERKHAEEALKKSEAKYRQLFDNSPAAIYQFDYKKGKITKANDLFCEYFGCSQEEITSLSIYDFLTEESKKLLLERMEKISQGVEVPEIVEYEGFDRKGKGWILQLHVKNIYDAEGNVVASDVVAHDITERKQAEKALRKSEEKYRTILESIQEGYYEIDLAGNITFFNDSLCRMIGYSKEELMGMNYRQYEDKESIKKVFQAYNKVYKTGEPVEGLDRQIIRKDGTKRYGETSISLQKDSSGKTIGFRGLARDITERKQMESSLQTSEENFRRSLDDSPLGVRISTIVGETIYANRAILDIYGYDSFEELKNTPLKERYTPESHADFKLRKEKRLRGEFGPSEYEIGIVRKNGKIRHLHVFRKEIFWNGKKQSQVIYQDITERKRAEEELKKSELKYRNIFENAIEGIYQSTIEGRFITANAALARMAGYDSPEELIESIKDIGTQLYVHPEDRKRFMEIRDTKGFVDGFEVEFYKKDGSTFWVVVNARVVKDEKGEILYNEGLIEDITIRKHAEEQLFQTLDSLRKAVGVTIHAMVSAIEMRDPYTAGHQIKVANLARAIATEMGLPQDKIEGIRMAGSIHDIGKLSIPAEILSKPTKLTNIEFSLIKEHSRSGYEILKDVESPWPLAEIVLQHHERMDGSGYPRNLKEDEILMEARIMAVADVVEAMASHRPYRPALGIDAALAEIEKNKGTHYDNAVADACLRLFREKGYKLFA